MVEKVRLLEYAGIKVVMKWDHEFRCELKNDPELFAFINASDVEKCLDPRDAFFGGCTNVMKLYRNAKLGEKIKYVDFTSLYPMSTNMIATQWVIRSSQSLTLPIYDSTLGSQSKDSASQTFVPSGTPNEMSWKFALSNV